MTIKRNHPIYARKQDNRFFRRLSRCLQHGYLLHERRPTSLIVPVAMNEELKDMQAARRNHRALQVTTAPTDLDPQSEALS